MTQENVDFMDLLEEDAWFEASARREESVDCEALAGYGWSSHLGSAMGNPQGYSHFSSAAFNSDANVEATCNRVEFGHWYGGG